MDIKKLEEHVLNKILKDFIFEQNGKKYINKDNFNTLKLTRNEMLFLLQVLDRNKIKLVNLKNENIDSLIKSKKRKKKNILSKQLDYFITQDDRVSKVENYTYGEVSEIKYQDHDVPVRALLEYDDFGNLIYEDYSDLNAYIEEVLIKEYVTYNKRYNTKIEDYEYIPSIKLHNIVRLKYSEREVEHIINYLEQKDITVNGFSSTIDGEFDNYKYYRNYKYLSKNIATIDAEENLKKFAEYNITKDPSLREEIIIANMKLVDFIAYPFAIGGKWSIHDLISYGSEGLIKAVDRFDISLGNKFSSFAFASIKKAIMRGIEEMRGYQDASLFSDITTAQNIVEEEYGEKLENNLEMLDDIFELLVVTGRVPEKNAEGYKRKELLRNACSIDEVAEDEKLSDDNTLYYQVFHNIAKEYIQEAIDETPEKLRKRVMEYYGLGNNSSHTHNEIGKMEGVSSTAIWQYNKNIRKKFNSYRHKSKLIAMLELLDEYNYEQPVGKIKKYQQNYKKK